MIDHRQVKKIALERDGKPASFVYPYWHPSGRYVAFSTNETHQDFHLSDENRIEVYDVESDVLIYDTEKERVFSSPLLASMACYETFPTFYSGWQLSAVLFGGFCLYARKLSGCPV